MQQTLKDKKKINHIRTPSKTRVWAKFGAAGTSSTPVSGLRSLCPHSNWPATSWSWSLKTWQVLGNLFATSCTAFLLPQSQSSDSFWKCKATIHRAVCQPWPSRSQQNAQQQHTQGADFRSAEICLDRGLNVLVLL